MLHSLLREGRNQGPIQYQIYDIKHLIYWIFPLLLSFHDLWSITVEIRYKIVFIKN